MSGYSNLFRIRFRRLWGREIVLSAMNDANYELQSESGACDRALACSGSVDPLRGGGRKRRRRCTRKEFRCFVSRFARRGSGCIKEIPAESSLTAVPANAAQNVLALRDNLTGRVSRVFRPQGQSVRCAAKVKMVFTKCEAINIKGQGKNGFHLQSFYAPYYPRSGLHTQ